MKYTCIALVLAAIAAPSALAFAPPSTGLSRNSQQQFKNFVGQKSQLFMSDPDYTVREKKEKTFRNPSSNK